MNSGIYGIFNKTNNKVYIGKASNFKSRWKDHIKLLNLNKHKNKHLQAAWNKDGTENFKFVILQLVDRKELTKIEQAWIDWTQCCNDKYGYNFCSIAGSWLGYKHTNTTKAKLAIIGKGRKHTLETRAKMSAWQIGRKLPEETKKKLSKFRKGRKHTKEVKLKLSLAHKGRILSDEHKLKISIATTGVKKNRNAKS